MDKQQKRQLEREQAESFFSSTPGLIWAGVILVGGVGYIIISNIVGAFS